MIQAGRPSRAVEWRALLVAAAIAWTGPRPAFAGPGPGPQDDDARPGESAAPPDGDDSADAPAGLDPGDARGVVAAVPGSSLARAVLIGPSGELYLPGDTPDTWHRRAPGGVAVDVRAAMSPKAGEFIVAGSRSPLYRSVGDVWRTVPLAQRGPVLLSADSGPPALSVAGHIHVLEGDSFRRVASARGRPTAIWASSRDRVYLASQGPKLEKWHNGSWSALRHPLAADDEILALSGRPNRSLYALARSGAVLSVGASAATLVSRPAELENLAPHAMTVARDGTLWLAGVLEAPSGAGPRPLALASHGAKNASLVAVPASDAPELPADDRVTVLIADAGALLLATRAGRIMLRDPDGRWRAGTLDTRVPDSARAIPAAARPARTR